MFLGKLSIFGSFLLSYYVINSQCPPTRIMVRDSKIHIAGLPQFSPPTERALGMGCASCGAIGGIGGMAGGILGYLSLVKAFEASSTVVAWAGIISLPPLIVGGTTLLSIPCLLLGAHYLDAQTIRTSYPPESSSLL